MPVFAIVLIAAGLAVLVLLLDRLDRPQAGEPELEPKPEPPPYTGLATPYREALDAAFRIQQAAWVAEQQMYAEAARHHVLPPVEGRTDA
jgi:hypothetical protein